IADRDVRALESFRTQHRDLYVPAGETGFWQGAIRAVDDPAYEPVSAAARNRERVMIDILYADADGGQRTVARFSVSDWPRVEGERADLIRVWNVDRDEPRERTLREDMLAPDRPESSDGAPTISKQATS